MHNNFPSELLLKNVLLDFYNTLNEISLNDQEKDLYQRIYFCLDSGEGFITNEDLNNLSNKTYSNNKKILKSLEEKQVITITRKNTPSVRNLRYDRFITCNICLNFKLLNQA